MTTDHTPDTPAHDPSPDAAAWDPYTLYSLASSHPDCATLASLGFVKPRQAAAQGLVPLPMPFPNKEQVWVPAERSEAIVEELSARAEQAARRPQLLARIRAAVKGGDFGAEPAQVPDRVRVARRVELALNGMPHHYRLSIDRTYAVEELEGIEGPALRDMLATDAKLTGRVDDALRTLTRRFEEIRGEATAEGVAEERNLADRLWRATHHMTDPNAILRRWEREFAVWSQDKVHARGRAFVDTHFDLSKFDELFPIARGLGRKLVLVIGPTNSGKTHTAMQALKEAGSGIYLAPLRLLALEVMDRLNKDGVAASLLTGEEEIRVPGARITSSTIEMMDPGTAVDVAVIDEVQMLADPERGWAWSAALVGAPAKTVYMLGSLDARPVIERIAAHLGESLEIVELERKVPLRQIDRRLEWADVEKGDALIAFSRREVHSVRETLRDRGLSAAVIYGALAPEVRRREAERFVSGEADVVVATDAIGMGLNLPVRRVLFTTLEKFDGRELRPLNGSEVRQIAGRAGRYGRFEIGEFGVVGRGSPRELRKLYDEANHAIYAGLPLTIRPTKMMLERLASHLGTDRLVPLVECFAAADTKGSPYQIADLKPMLKMAVALDARRLGFDERLTLLFMPADLERETDADLVYAACRALEREQPLFLEQVAGMRLDRLDDLGLEALSRTCDLYYWSARKFPALFPDRELVAVRRGEVADRLAQVLAMRSRVRAGGAPGKPKPGFRGAPRKRYGPKRR
ncbi:MAG TPA: helicase-related protein [Azospirillaceae bacterium]|nr:helicase-related protein [Azospirillaceae bacterium]